MQPGAVEVYERHTGQLVPCTKELCTDSVDRGGRTIYLNRAPFSPVGGWAWRAGLCSMGWHGCSWRLSLQQHKLSGDKMPMSLLRLLVWLSCLQEGGVASGVNPQQPLAFQELAFKFFALLGSPSFSLKPLVFNALSPAGPSRFSDISNKSFANWTQVGCCCCCWLPHTHITAALISMAWWVATTSCCPCCDASPCAGGL